MKQPHKHAELIKAWADGAEIEFRWSEKDSWGQAQTLTWYDECFYRIKPEPKPDHVVYPSVANSWEGNEKTQWFVKNHLKLTFDGETGKLKSAEVL